MASPKKDKLTDKDENYIRLLLQGMSQRQAYKKAFKPKNMTDNTIDRKACELFNSSKVQGRYKELQKELDDKAILSAVERMKLLSRIAKDEEKEKKIITNSETKEYEEKEYPNSNDTKMKAIDLLNKMDNTYQTNINLVNDAPIIKIERPTRNEEKAEND